MPRVLLVDDDPDILETLRFAFLQEGFEVDGESDGARALERARSAPPDVAVLDVMLPGLNGYEISRRLKGEMQDRRLPGFPILLLTARRVDDGSRREFLETWSGADATMWKPFDLEKLLARVHALAATLAHQPTTGDGT